MPEADASLAKRGVDQAMQRSLLPMAVALAANYGVAVVYHSLSWPAPAAVTLVVATALTFAVFAVSTVWFKLRLPPASHASTIGGLFGLLVIGNVTIHYWLTARPVFTSQYLVVVIVAGAVILSRLWTAALVFVLLSAWAITSATFYTTADWIEYGGYLAATTALALGLNVARRRMVTRLEATRHAAELGQEALRRAEADLREIIEKAPEGMLIHREGEVIYANPTFATLLRAPTPDALVGKQLQSLIHPEPGAPVEPLLGGESPERGPTTHGFVRSDGERVMLEIGTTRAIRFQGATAVLITARDVTARHEELQARLLIADRMAAVGTVAAGVAHEINNPLSFVIDNLATMAKALDEPSGGGSEGAEADLAQLLADSRAGAERIRRIVRGLKAFSRVDEGAPELLDLEELILSSLRLARNEVRHRARVEEDYQPVPPVRGDSARLGQVILNLVVNAAHAIQEGEAGANVIVLATSTDGAGQAVITVTDSGCGIPSDQQDRIFDPFFTTKPVGVGTGLGLYFCHNVVVAELGGQLSVESRPGEGATFRIVLPPAEPEDQPTAEPPVERALSEDEEESLDVLIIDDEPQLARALSRLLGEHQVTIRTSPVQALEELGTADYDVILCDLMMPEMTGQQLFEQLAELRPGMERRVAFMTGGAFTPGAARFLDEVDNPVLDKPMNHQLLRRVIRELAAAARLGQS